MTTCALPLAQWLTFICFGIWALGTAIIFTAATFDKVNFITGKKLDFNNHYHIVLVTTAIAWVSMWCFRTMY